MGCYAKKGVYSYCREIKYARGTPLLVCFIRLLWRTFLHAAPPMSPREVCNCSRSSSAPAALRLFPPVSSMTQDPRTAAMSGFYWVSKVKGRKSKVFERQWRRSSTLTFQLQTFNRPPVTVCSRLKNIRREAVCHAQLARAGARQKPIFSGSCRQLSAGWVALSSAPINWNG